MFLYDVARQITNHFLKRQYGHAGFPAHHTGILWRSKYEITHNEPQDTRLYTQANSFV